MTRFAWDDLQYFLAVARTGQLSAAARRLRSNHVTVSRRIDRLEQALAMRLFERSPRGYVLTILGERLVEHAETIEREADRFTDTLVGGPTSLRGTVRLSTPEGFGNFFLGERLPLLARQHPSLMIELVTIQQIVSLSRREADLSLALHRPASGPYRCEEVVAYRLFLYASRDYLARSEPIQRRDDIVAHPLIGYIEDMIFTPGLDYVREILPGMRASYQSSSIQAQLGATLAGYGVCILPYYIASRHPELVAILPREINIERVYWMTCHDDLAGVQRVRLVSEFLLAQAAAASAVFGGEALLR